MAHSQFLNMNFAGTEWQALKEWLLHQKGIKTQKLIQTDTDQREVENIRGSLQFIELLLVQERSAANRNRE